MMKLADLVNYAKEKYQIIEEPLESNFLGYAVLINPKSKQWIAVLMRQQDQDSGTTVERCDLKCGRYNMYKYKLPYLSPAYKMRGQSWLGISLNQNTNPNLICRLFDLAIRTDNKSCFTIVINNPADHINDNNTYHESLIPFADQSCDTFETAPIREMKQLYQEGDGSFAQKCKNFYTQGMFMKNYADDFPWHGKFKCYFPTYHSLNDIQLRAYFSWRTRIRNGEYRPICKSMAYIYIYELLNQIGTDSPEDSLHQMKEFEKCFLTPGFGDENMKKNLQWWMQDFAIIHNLPVQTAQNYVQPSIAEKDHALSALKNPDQYSDIDIFTSLSRMNDYKLTGSKIVIQNPAESQRLFAGLWKYLTAHYNPNQNNDHHRKTIFSAIFGDPVTISRVPLSNAVVYINTIHPDCDYQLNDCRSYCCRQNKWYETYYPSVNFNTRLLSQLIHAADRLFRQYLKISPKLKEKQDEAWISPYIAQFIESDKAARLEASKPVIHINFSELDQIRKDAVFTRDSLLTEDEMDHTGDSDDLYFPDDIQPTDLPPKHQADNSPSLQPDINIASNLPDDIKPRSNPPIASHLDETHIHILQMLINQIPVCTYISSHYLMPSVIADTINEALFDDIGDNIIECDGDSLTIIEDYRDEITKLLAGDGTK